MTITDPYDHRLSACLSHVRLSELTRHHDELGLLRFHLHERELVVVLQRILRLVDDLQDGVRHRVRAQIRLVERALDDHAILIADQHTDHRLVRGLDSLQYLVDFVLFG